MITLLLGIVFVLALAFGTPLYLVFGGLAVILFMFQGTDMSIVAMETSRIATSPVLITIPLFTFAGYLLAESGSPRRLINLTRALVGWFKGGTAIVAILACAFFTSFTGASSVTIIALGGLLLPMLISDKYSSKFSLGLLTTNGSLGLLFPPSLLLIIYGTLAEVDVTRLFIAGILPGTLLVMMMSMLAIKEGRNAVTQPFEFKKLLTALKEAFWEIPLPIVVLGGIYTGTIAPSEAAVLTALYAFIIEVFIYRDISITKDIPRIIRSSMIVVGGIFVILGSAMALTYYLVDMKVPDAILAWMQENVKNKYVFLLMLNIFLIVVAAVLDVFSALVVVLPLIVPIATQVYGINPVHLAIIFITNLEIGYALPPAGINLFIASFRFRKPVIELAKSTIPFLVILVVGLMIITYVPGLSLFLVDVLLKK